MSPSVRSVRSSLRRLQDSVLIVDDESDAREMMTLYLEYCGYIVHAATNGVDAIDLAVRAHPGIVLMDLMMPRMDGWETARRLRADPRTRDISIIALSARSQGDEDHAAQLAGCDAFIAKPCNLDHLATTLRDFFHRRPPRSRNVLHARRPTGRLRQ